MGRAAGGPVIHKSAQPFAETEQGVRIPKLQRSAFHQLALGQHQHVLTVGPLSNGSHGYRPGCRSELGQKTAAWFTVEDGAHSEQGFFIGDVRIARPAVPDDAKILIEIHRIQLGQRCAAGQGFHQRQRDRRFDVGLNRAGDPLPGQHGEDRIRCGDNLVHIAAGLHLEVVRQRNQPVLIHQPAGGQIDLNH